MPGVYDRYSAVQWAEPTVSLQPHPLTLTVVRAGLYNNLLSMDSIIAAS